MYKVTLILPGTKEGIKELQKTYSRLLAKAAASRLRPDELKGLIDKLENEKE